MSNKGLWAHSISSTSFPFLFSNPFCTICRIVSLILVYLVAFKSLSVVPLSEDSGFVQSPTKNVSLPLLITCQIQLDRVLKRKDVTQPVTAGVRFSDAGGTFPSNMPISK